MSYRQPGSVSGRCRGGIKPSGEEQKEPMKKWMIPTLLAALLLLSGCGGASEKSAYTAEDVTTLLDSGAFTGDMEQVESTVAVSLFGLDADTVEEITCYMATNSSVSADEVAVFVLTDEDAAVAAESACQAHVESRIESSAQYCPDQVPKLEDAVISRLGNTVLLAVGETEALNTAIESLT